MTFGLDPKTSAMWERGRKVGWNEMSGVKDIGRGVGTSVMGCVVGNMYTEAHNL